MLRITIPGQEFWDEQKEEFIQMTETTLQLEHSLISLSKWESKWHKPFLNKEKKTEEETIDYIRCMTLTQNVNPDVYSCLSQTAINEIEAYIDDPMTATWFSEKDKTPPSREVVTAEIIYYWMVTLNIPFECQKWHLNRLLTLIKVCNVKNTPDKKRSQKDINRDHAAINAARRKAMKARKK